MTEQRVAITSDDRLLAGLAHLLGWVVALIVWATQKDRSRYVRFQAVQALAFDGVVIVVVFLLMGCLMGGFFLVMFLTMAGTMAAANSGDPGSLAWFFWLPFGQFLIWIPMVLGMGAVFLIRLFAAWNVLQGRDFRYPWLGRQVERFLQE